MISSYIQASRKDAAKNENKNKIEISNRNWIFHRQTRDNTFFLATNIMPA